MVAVLGAGEGGAVGVPRGSGSGGAPWPVFVFSVWWVSGTGDLHCSRGGDEEPVCQGCASGRHASRPLT